MFSQFYSQNKVLHKIYNCQYYEKKLFINDINISKSA